MNIFPPRVTVDIAGVFNQFYSKIVDYYNQETMGDLESLIRDCANAATIVYPHDFEDAIASVINTYCNFSSIEDRELADNMFNGLANALSELIRNIQLLLASFILQCQGFFPYNYNGITTVDDTETFTVLIINFALDHDEVRRHRPELMSDEERENYKISELGELLRDDK